MKRRRRLVALLIIIIIISFILWLIFKDKAYEIEYDLDDYKINEEFNSDNDFYYYTITYGEVNYSLLLNSKYEGKKLITKIKAYEVDNDVCLNVVSSISEDLLCSRNGKMVSNYLVNDELINELDIPISSSSLIGEHDDLEIYYKFDKKLYLWNYYGFNYLINDEVDNIKLFDNSVYDSSLVGYIDGYFVLPNYEDEFNYNELIFFDVNTNEYEVFEMDYSLSDDSFIIGIDDKSIFYGDPKNDVIYEVVPDKEKMRIYGSRNSSVDFLVDGIYESVSVNEILDNELVFTYDDLYKFKLQDNSLYISYYDSDLIRISDLEVDEIVYTYDNFVLYLVDNSLYAYYNDVEYLLLKRDEWLFNSDNKIFMVI